jgi:polyribonucleotide nucleotidyltransferase
MFSVHKKELDWCGKPLVIETGRVARQADGAALVTYGETSVLATVCFQREPKAGVDFFPLTVNYQERFYAAGRIPGGFFKREGRPSEKETLTSRLIDRPIRPLFSKGFKNETQVVCTVMSSDKENDPDVVAMVAASAALALSGVPFQGPIGACRVGYVDGAFVFNPTLTERDESDLDLMVAGTEEGVLMVESEASELSEEVMLDAVMQGHAKCQEIIKAVQELVKSAAKPAFEMPEQADHSALEADLLAAFGDDIKNAYKIQAKQDRQNRLNEIKETALDKFAGSGDARDEAQAELVGKIVKGMQATVLRADVLASQTRIDGRSPSDVRPIVAEVDVLPRVHGSALFTRGETQALVVATLGTGRDEQLIDAIDGEYQDSFMLHYNFPPYCVGETGRMGSPGRREIGHGKLARRSIERLLPSPEQFPYTLRVVSEITESNGSSSMATVCGTSLALMAAGVPMAKPVAGIAMGLVKEDRDYVVLSDIMGDEDHLGDMDFKVAGTEDGVTALQMDIKITSITKDIMQQALDQAKAGRLHILGKMAQALTASRGEISRFAPAMESFPIDKEDIRTVIGSGGKTIRELQETTGCTIDISDDGTVTVSSVSRASLDECVSRIQGLVAKPEVGETYTGPITSTPEFGAFVRILPQHEGLLHISEIADFRINNINDALNEGEVVTVKVMEMDDRGKIRLTIKGIEQSEEIAERIVALADKAGDAPEDGGRSDRGNRDRGDRGGRGRSDRDRGGNRRPRRRD